MFLWLVLRCCWWYSNLNFLKPRSTASKTSFRLNHHPRAFYVLYTRVYLFFAPNTYILGHSQKPQKKEKSFNPGAIWELVGKKRRKLRGAVQKVRLFGGHCFCAIYAPRRRGRSEWRLRGCFNIYCAVRAKKNFGDLDSLRRRHFLRTLSQPLCSEVPPGPAIPNETPKYKPKYNQNTKTCF